MSRLTRKSYNRRLLFVGLLLFISVGLISTGFAAWVMSTNSKEEGNGTVTGAAISDKAITVTIQNQENLGKFIFDSAENDTTGRLRWDGVNHEIMTVTVKGTVSNIDILSSLTVKLDLPAEIQKAVEQGYIVAPECATSPVDITKQAKVSTPGEFSFDIKFTWGTKFGGMNPSLFFDNEASADIDDAQMKEMLVAFRTVLNKGSKPADETVLSSTYKVIVEAKAN